MNIFYLSIDVTRCAQYHCDKHVVKMVLETAQILSTAAQLVLPDSKLGGVYRATHVHHPCVKYAAARAANFEFVASLGRALSVEYIHRYNRVHASSAVIERCLDTVRSGSPLWRYTDSAVSTLPQAMPSKYKHQSALIAYRRYYAQEKNRFLTYTGRTTPYWLADPVFSVYNNENS